MKRKRKTSKNATSTKNECHKRKLDILEVATKKRHLALLEKVQRGKALTGAEMRDLKRLEGPADLSAGQVTSLEAVANAFKVSLRSAQRWASEGMPVSSEGVYDLIEIQAWRHTKSEISSSDNKSWETAYRKFKALLAEIEYQKRIGDLVPREEVEAGMIDRITAVKMQFLALPQRLAPQLDGLDVNEREALLTDRIEEIIQEFADGKH